MAMWKQVPLIVVISASIVFGVRSQTIQEGEWFGAIMHSNGAYMNVNYKVRSIGDSLQIAIEAGSRGSFHFRKIRVTSDTLFFVWDDPFNLSCMLSFLPDGVYQGVCQNPLGDIGGIIMVPPGTDRKTLTLDQSIFRSIAGMDYADSETEEWLLGESYPKGRMIELDGTAINYVDAGDGPAAVVLIAGLGENLSSWELLQQRLARNFRVIAYDRPGLGLSEESALPRTPLQMAMELHGLLERIDAPFPCLLVAHAEGSLIVRQFADMYAEKVRGLVLIHPHHEEQGKLWETLDAEAWHSYWSRMKNFQSALPGGMGQEFGVYASIIDGELDAELSETPSVPTVVLTASRTSEFPTWLADSRKGQRAWREFHASWVENMPSGTHMVLESGHLIHQEYPGRVEEVIHALLSDE